MCFFDEKGIITATKEREISLRILIIKEFVMAGAWSVASGMMLRDWFRKSEIKEERIEYAKELDEAEQMILEGYGGLGYLARMDKVGYLRASGKARQTFKNLNPKDTYLGMLRYYEEKKSYGLNFDYIAVVEDYFFEMKRNYSQRDYLLGRYNELRNRAIEELQSGKIFKDKTEEERRLLIEKSKNERNIFTVNPRNFQWDFYAYEDYADCVRRGELFCFVPIS